MKKIIFLVNRAGGLIENVIVEATTREYAKSYAQPILGGDPDSYVVEPITSPGAKSVILVGVN